MNVNNSFLARSGQRWKLYSFYTTFVLIFFGKFLAKYIILKDVWDSVFLKSYIVFTSVGALIVFMFAISFKCPNCKSNLVVPIVKRSKYFKFFSDFESFKNCPYCGCEGD